MRKSALKRRSPLKKHSQKGEAEIGLRRQLKAELIAEHGEHCMTCNDKFRDFRGISLSHIVALSRLGETTKENCLLECGFCHDRYEKRPHLRPLWQQKRAGLIYGGYR